MKESYDPNELKEYNKRNLTRVTPYFTEREKENFNFYTPYYLGCQFICMNYTEPTDFMRAYVKKFGKCSLILKPYKLRYKPTLIKAHLNKVKKFPSHLKRLQHLFTVLHIKLYSTIYIKLNNIVICY